MTDIDGWEDWARPESFAEEDSPFDCTECPDDPRPHTHSPWGGLHKVYADEAEQRLAEHLNPED